MQKHPVLFQCNTRIAARDLQPGDGLTLRPSPLPRDPILLEDFPDSFLDAMVQAGIDILWLLSVWETSKHSQQMSRTNPHWVAEFQQTLHPLYPNDIGGSGFALASYHVSEQLGGPNSLAILRKRLNQRGIKLMLDFVPNHMGLDHPWMDSNPEFLVQGNEQLLELEPQNYFRHPQSGTIFAHGRDPFFSGWVDTVQLDYSNPKLQQTMQNELMRVAEQCDAVRCDMAMLLTPRVFKQTWGKPMKPFWSEAIRATKSRFPEFLLMAEVYWDMEWELQQQGFDYCYDKRLYDRLRDGETSAVRNHLQASVEYQSKLARFLENHDEPRAATAFPIERHIPASAVTYLTPGLRFFHQGQLEGFQKRISPHLVRGPSERIDPQIQDIYQRILDLLRDPIFHEGEWELLEIQRAWEDNWSSDCLLAWVWYRGVTNVAFCVVNLADHEAQGTVVLPKWLHPLAPENWMNLWTDEPFEMPLDQWQNGEWTVFMQRSQVIIAEYISKTTNAENREESSLP